MVGCGVKPHDVDPNEVWKALKSIFLAFARTIEIINTSKNWCLLFEAQPAKVSQFNEPSIVKFVECMLVKRHTDY